MALYGPTGGSGLPLGNTSSSLFGSLFSSHSILPRLMGLSVFASLFSELLSSGKFGRLGNLGNIGKDGVSLDGGYVWGFVGMFTLALVVEGCRRLLQWVLERVRLQYSITAQFAHGDPAYEWLILFLTDAQVWKSSRDFRVSARSSKRTWDVKPVSLSYVDESSTLARPTIFQKIMGFLASFHLSFLGDTAHIARLPENIDVDSSSRPDLKEHVQYVPTYDAPQLFRWKGYWIEIKRHPNKIGTYPTMPGGPPVMAMYVTMYTHDMRALSAFVDEARLRYVKTSRPHVVVHSADQSNPGFGPKATWTNTKSKQRRPLSSIILQEGIISSLVADAKEFLAAEDWYSKAGIPHRRGYLLYGPPGTGKTSTIYAMAGELGLEIYSLSLASNFVDDGFLQRAVQAVPKNTIILIEDIDCAFPAPRDGRDDDDEEEVASAARPVGIYGPAYPMGMRPYPGYPGRFPIAGAKRSLVTLSGLLNVLDGVGSEEGKIFFATTNHIDHLDAAFLRPGRIDKKVQYQLATQAQAKALFLRFYPEDVYSAEVERRRLGVNPGKPSFTDLFSLSPETLCEKSAPNGIDSIKATAKDGNSESSPITQTLSELGDMFSLAIPPHQFSTAEIQGFLLSCKLSPFNAASTVAEWIAQELQDRENKGKKAEARAKRLKEKSAMLEEQRLKEALKRLAARSAPAKADDDAEKEKSKATNKADNEIVDAAAKDREKTTGGDGDELAAVSKKQPSSAEGQ